MTDLQLSMPALLAPSATLQAESRVVNSALSSWLVSVACARTLDFGEAMVQVLISELGDPPPKWFQQ